MKKFLFLLICGFVYVTAFAQFKPLNIIDYGAVADAKTVNTLAIQKAIDMCNTNGGGTVYVPAGTFITGTLSLKSNVNLHLENGALLKGSNRLSDYRSYTNPGFGTNYYGVLYTENAHDVSITGSGEINGNDAAFFEWDKAKTIDSIGTRFTRQKNNYRHVSSGIGDGPVVPKERPHQMVIFSNCENVVLRDVKLLNSAFWTLHFADCDAVLVSGIRVWSNFMVPNADGIDVTSCTNVTISDCDIRTGDDAIAIVGYASHFEVAGFKNLRHISENILINNCNLQSYSSGIRIGFLDQNTVRNVHVNNVNITNSTRGIGVFLRDEGSLENMTFSNMYIDTKLRTGDWWGNGEPIHISAIRGKDKVQLGKIHNIKFENIICKGENGLIIYGTDESLIEDISFNHVNFELTDSKLNDVAGGNVDLRGVIGEKNQIFQRDIPGFLIEHAKNITINDFKLTWTNTSKPYFTHGIEANNFSNLHITDFNGAASPVNKNAARVYLGKGNGFIIDDPKGVVKKK